MHLHIVKAIFILRCSISTAEYKRFNIKQYAILTTARVTESVLAQ